MHVKPSTSLLAFMNSKLLFMECNHIVRTPPPPPLQRGERGGGGGAGGIDFLKFGNKGGDEIFSSRKGGVGLKGGFPRKGGILHFYINFS